MKLLTRTVSPVLQRVGQVLGDLQLQAPPLVEVSVLIPIVALCRLPAASRPAAGRRLSFIVALRACAALIILWHHFALYPHPGNQAIFQRVDRTREANAKPAAPFALKDYAGKEIQLASFKGQVVLLNFWHPT